MAKLTHRLAEGDAADARPRAGASPGQLVAGGVMAIADLGVAEAAVVVQEALLLLPRPWLP